MKPKLLIFSNFDWIFVCVIVLLSGLFLVTPFFNYNNQAVLYMIQKKYDKAEQKWLQALNKKSLIPFYRMNLALNYLLSHQADKAIQENTVTSNLVKQIKKHGKFKEQLDPRLRGDDSLRREGGLRRNNRLSREKPASAKTGDGNPEKKQKQNLLEIYKKQVLFYSFFNSAIAATVKGEVKSALNFYQKALMVQPKSLEVKTNIELLVNTNASSKDKKSSPQNSDNQEKKEGEEEGESKKEEGESGKSEKSQNQDKKKNKEGNNKQDSGDDTKEEEKKKSGGQKNKSESPSGSSKKSSIDKKQQEAILKAILEGEKKIRERRNKSGRGSSAIEKDW